jgi:hypothetical protein
MPVIVAVAAATGASAAVGAAVAGIVGATVSTAVATAIGSGIIAGAVTAAQGGNASQILTSAVVGGVSSGIGSAVSGAVAGAAQSAAQSAGYTAISQGFGQVVGGIAGGAASGATSAYMTGQSAKEGALSGGLLGGLASAAQAGYDYLTAPKADTTVGFAPNTTKPEGGFHTTTDLATTGLNSGPAGKVPSMYGEDFDGMFMPKGVETNPLLAGQQPGASNVRVLQAQGPANQIDTGVARTNVLTGRDAVAAVNSQVNNPVYSPTAQLKLENAYQNALSTTPGVRVAGTTSAAPAATTAAAQPSGGFLSTAMDKLSDPWVAVPIGLSLMGSKPQQPQAPSAPPMTEEQQAAKEQFYEPLPVYTMDRDYVVQPNTVDWTRYGREEPGTERFFSDAYYRRAKEGGSIHGYADGGKVDEYSDTGRLKRFFGGTTTGVAYATNPGEPLPPGTVVDMPFGLGKVMSAFKPVPTPEPERVPVFTAEPAPTPSPNTVVPSSAFSNVVDPTSYLASRRNMQSLVDNKPVDPYKYVPRARSYLSAFRDNPEMFNSDYFLQSQRPYGYAKGGEVDSYSDTGRVKKMIGGITGFIPMLTPTMLNGMAKSAGLSAPGTTTLAPTIMTGQIQPRIPTSSTTGTTSTIPTPSPNTVVPSDSVAATASTYTPPALTMLDPSSYLTPRRTDRSLVGGRTPSAYDYQIRPRSMLSKDSMTPEERYYYLLSQRPYGYAMGGDVNDSGINSANFNQVPNANQPNYYTYGSVPQKSQPMMMKKGGISDGRADDIPALLSDGEYVIDAETVALLGNGSSEAGSKQLDHMRQQIRKQKGGALAKGHFSPDAKSPLAYFKQRTA